MNAAIDRYPSRNGNAADFSARHDPVVYSSNLSHAPIAREFIEQYAEEGYLVLEDVFSEDEVTLFQQEAEQLLQSDSMRGRDEIISEPGSGDIRSIFRVHALSPVFRKLCADQRLAGLAEYILGDAVYMHQTRLNYKPGFRGKEFYWHSDFETWHVEDGMPSMRALSMSVTLTDNHPINGPLMLIPGSHREYLVCTGETPAMHFQKSLKKQEYGVPDDESLSELVERHGIVQATGRPGSVIIFDCNMMHGSGSNITPYPRSNIFLVYNAMQNRVQTPYCQQAPRPEYIASRQRITPISARPYGPRDYA